MCISLQRLNYCSGSYQIKPFYSVNLQTGTLVNSTDLDEIIDSLTFQFARIETNQMTKMHHNLSHDMGFPTMWYVRPAKPQISLRIRAV